MIKIIRKNYKYYRQDNNKELLLCDLFAILGSGNEIQVIDEKTKTDITYMIQIQKLFRNVKRNLNVVNNNDPMYNLKREKFKLIKGGKNE